jgi:hypothetical protein
MRIAAIFALVAAAAIATAQSDEPPSPTPIAFTSEPRQLQWRIGFNLGNAIALETPELNPKGNAELAIAEADRVLPSPELPFGLALLPAAKVLFESQKLINPKKWTILDLHGKTEQKSFQGLGIFMGTRMTTREGGYHLVSVPLMSPNPFLGLRHEPANEDLIFGFAGSLKGKLQLHTRLSETKWENLLPVEDTSALPAGFEAAQALLDDHPSDDHKRFFYGTSIEALIRNEVRKLWLFNYSHPDTTLGTHPWGVFLEQDGHLQPLYVYKPTSAKDPYVAYFTAAVDLDRDGTDELIIEASYRIGTAYKVISNVGGKYQETFTSYYRGPAS